MKLWLALKAGFAFVRWILRLKKQLETNTQAALSPERAKALRLRLEVIFKALEQGAANPNFKQLPKWLRALCEGTTIDNYIGAFGQNVLKSNKLERDDPILTVVRLGDIGVVGERVP